MSTTEYQKTGFGLTAKTKYTYLSNQKQYQKINASKSFEIILFTSNFTKPFTLLLVQYIVKQFALDIHTIYFTSIKVSRQPCGSKNAAYFTCMNVCIFVVADKNRRVSCVLTRSTGCEGERASKLD